MENLPVALVVIGVGLIFAVTGLAIYLALRRETQRGVAAQQQARDLEERQRRAVWAGATVVSARSARTDPAQDRVRVELRLKVQPASCEPYQAAATWLVEAHAVSQLQPGQEVSVRIDVDDPKRVYPNASWAKPFVTG